MQKPLSNVIIDFQPDWHVFNFLPDSNNIQFVCVSHTSSSLKFTYFLPLSASECSSTWESGFCLCVCVLLGCVCLQCISGQNDTFRKEVEFCSNCAICERSTRVATIQLASKSSSLLIFLSFFLRGIQDDCCVLGMIFE
uniref:(northern house mosquito) hypothetical protein n=1 Tax=Culex pipiens TaxID=7175 RepID=A0A8D8BFT1_CULPI